MLHPGDRAPDIVAHDQSGERWDLKTALEAGPVVMFFYPKDFTSVCTSEVCLFQTRLDAVQSHGAQVVGVSADSAESHQRFSQTHGLRYPLLVDAKRHIAKQYEALYFGFFPKRITYVIGQDQRIVAAVHHELNAQVHVEKALNALSQTSPRIHQKADQD